MPGGKIVLMGMGHPIQTLPISKAALKEVDLIGVFHYANQYPKAINLISKHHGILGNIDKLVTARYHLEQAKEAFEAVQGGKEVKVMVTN
jgi:L-iditol 2-dehydrogenase